ncbi:MAG: formate dehydrogenase accessory sulfurtransferase FdhD [Halobacteriota archaeon]
MEQNVKDDKVMCIVKISESSEDKLLRRYREDLVVREAEVRIKVGGKIHTRLFCLPSHFEELAIGHLKSEGLDPSYISNIEVEKVNLEMYEIQVKLEQEVYRNPLKVNSEIKIKKGEVRELVKKLEDCSILYKATGGTHVVASFNQEKGETSFIEDISRHCAIDKLIGTCIKNGIEIPKSVLVTSCRHTHSTIKKVIFAGFPVVISISAPTELAILDAEEFCISLVGFARDNRFNVYSNDWRIL